MRANTQHKDDFRALLSALRVVAMEHTESVDKLPAFTSTPIKSEKELLLRAEVMDEMIDIAQNQDDIILVFAHAIAGRIEEYEDKNLLISDG